MKNSKINELFLASEIYCDRYLFMQIRPQSIVFEFIGRFNKKPHHICSDFGKESGLILESGTIGKEIGKDLFRVDDGWSITFMYFTFDQSYLCVETVSDLNDRTILYLINAKTTKELKKVDFRCMVDTLDFHLTPYSGKFSNINLFESKIYYTTSNGTLYITDFNDNHKKLKDYNEKVIHIESLNPRYLLVVLNNYFEVINKTKLKVLYEKDFENSYFSHIETNLPSDIILTKHEFDKIETVTILIGLSNKTIIVYVFETKVDHLTERCTIDLSRFNDETVYFCIDRAYIMSYVLVHKETHFYDPNVLIKLLIASNMRQEFEIVQVNKNSSFETVHKRIMKFKNAASETIEFESYMKNTVLVKYESHLDSEIILVVFNLSDKTSLVRSFYDVKRLYSIDENIIITQSNKNMELLEYNGLEMTQISEIDLTLTDVFNDSRNDFKLIDRNLVWIDELESRVLKINLSAINLQSTNFEEFHVRSIHQTIDDNHILATTARYNSELFDLAIINVITQMIVHTIIKNVSPQNFILFGIKNSYLVCVKLEECRLVIYEIKNKILFKDESVFESLEVYHKFIDVSIKYNWRHYRNLNRVHFMDNENIIEFYLTLYDSIKDKIEISLFRLDEEERHFKQVSNQVFKLETIETDKKDLKCILSTINGCFLVLWQHERKLIFYIDIKNNCTLQSFDVETPITEDGILSFLENNFFVCVGDSVCTRKILKLEINHGVINKTVIKQFDDEVSSEIIRLKNNLFISFRSSAKLEIYDIEKNTTRNVQLFYPIQDYGYYTTVTTDVNYKYLILMTIHSMLSVFDMHSLRQISTVRISEYTQEIIATKTHICVIIPYFSYISNVPPSYKLFTFSIVDP